MTEKEMKKLSRADLLELLVTQVRENDRLEKEVALLKAKLQLRRMDLDRAGSIAQAAMELNHVFESAQAAADLYLENIRRMEEETRERCRMLPDQTGEETPGI